MGVYKVYLLLLSLYFLCASKIFARLSSTVSLLLRLAAALIALWDRLLLTCVLRITNLFSTLLLFLTITGYSRGRYLGALRNVGFCIHTTSPRHLPHDLHSDSFVYKGMGRVIAPLASATGAKINSVANTDKIILFTLTYFTPSG